MRTLGTCLLLLVALFAYKKTMPGIITALKLSSFSTTKGSLTHFETRVSGSGAPKTKVPVAKYQYNVNGETFHADIPTLYHGFSKVTDSFIKDLKRAYNSNEPIAVYYNPDDPQEAYLTKSISIFAIIFDFVFILPISALGIYLLIQPWNRET